MRTPIAISIAASCLALASLTITREAEAVGESDADGFPSWEERVQHELANRARVAPQIEMTACGANCAEAACYTAQPPLYYERALNKAARFHAAHQTLNGYFAHTSSCTLTDDIGTTYPGTCNGAASCSCVGGTNSCSGSCTSFDQRIGRFGAGASGEIIASGGGAEGAFYLWLYEPTDDPQCNFTFENGHRWLLLTSQSSVGFGANGVYVGDFGSAGAPETNKIASGSHWPEAGSVEAWANWYDTAGPQSALVNVDGECTAMSLGRGTDTNGAYTANVTGGTCSRYFFLFKDSTGTIVTFPTTGSLAIGSGDGCPDWSSERPTTGASCECTAQCAGKVCGDDTCGGSCGNCDVGSTCDATGQCVGDATTATSATSGPGATTGEGPGAGPGGGADTTAGPGAGPGGGDDGPTAAGPGSGSGNGSGTGSGNGSGNGSGTGSGNGSGTGSGSGSGSGGAGGGDAAEDGGEGDGCGCRTAGAPGSRSAFGGVAIAMVIAWAARRKRRASNG